MNSLLKFFWKVWKKEYLVSLRESHKCSRKMGANNINVGDVVIIHDERKPRHVWKLGHILVFIKDIDGVVQAAKLKTGRSTGFITGPLNKLYPLEVADGLQSNGPLI